MKQKAFIFDMDGVILDSERMWEEKDPYALYDVLGAEIAEQIDDAIGISVDEIYERAVKLGSKLTKEEYNTHLLQKVTHIYGHSTITPGLKELLETLRSKEFNIGLYTSSPRSWMDVIFPRIPHLEYFNYTLSVCEIPGLQPKPNPEGYKIVMERLGAEADQTIILEDSNSGITAGKAAGAYTIGFSGNLPNGYIQKGADVYAHTMIHVMNIVENFL